MIGSLFIEAGGEQRKAVIQLDVTTETFHDA